MGQQKLATGLYGRTSKDDPRRVTIEIQQQTLRDWAARDLLVDTVVEEFWDDGVTGKLPLWERPAGKRLLEDIRSGRIKAVAVAYADRFGRTLLDGLQAVKTLENHGAKLVAVNDGWDARRDDSPLYFQFRMMMAEEEHRRISQRMKDGKRRAMDRDDAPPGGPLTFGYRMDQHGRFAADPVEAPIVVHLFEMALQGVSHAEMLRWVISTGVPAGRKFQKRAPGSEPVIVRNHTNASWGLTKIGKILRNATYLGRRTWGGRTFPCVALVGQDEFDRVQNGLTVKSAKFGIGKFDPTKGLLSGIFTCASCGATFYHKATVSHRGNGQVDRYQVYICDNMRRNSGCHAKMIRVDEMDRMVWQTVVESTRNPHEIASEFLQKNERLGDKEVDLNAAEAKCYADISTIEDEVRSLWEEQKKNGWPVSWIAPRLNELNQRREQVVLAMSELRKRRATVAADQDTTDEISSLVAKFNYQLDNATDPVDKYKMLRLIIADGQIHTSGAGRHKMGTVSFVLHWGKAVSFMVGQSETTGNLHPLDSPKTGLMELLGMQISPVNLDFGRVPAPEVETFN